MLFFKPSLHTHATRYALALCMLLVPLLVSTPAQAILLEDLSSANNLLPAITIHIDPTGRQTYDEIRQLPPGAFDKPQKTAGTALNLGIINNSCWIKFSLQRASDAPKEWVLEIPYLGLDEIDFYAPGLQPVITGAAREIKTRALFNRFFVFPVEVRTIPEEYYLRVKSNYAMTIPLEVYERQTFIESTQKSLIVQFLYFGGLLALALYNLQLYLVLRDKTYLLYGLFGIFMGLAIFAGNGFARILIWPDQAQWDQISPNILLCIGACFSIWFARSFLKTKRLTPKLDLTLQALSACYMIIALGLISTLQGLSTTTFWFQLLMLLTAPYFLLITVAAIRIALCGHESAKYYLLAWCCLCIGTVTATLRVFDWVPTNLLTAYAIQIGLGLEMLLLSFALAYRIRVEKARREQAQKQALESHQIMVDSLLRSEERLEHLVADRTSKLETSLAKEKKMHEQYARFGAMISHEFRNPLNNIQSQADLLAREHRVGIDQFDKRIGVIAAATRQLALLFDRWMQTDRLNNALTLRNVRPIDINLWLEELIKRYQQSSPDHLLTFRPNRHNSIILADESLIQIALINLLDNACKYSASGKAIVISLVYRPQMVGIEVTDQGEGIDPSAHAAIFEEYFRVNPAHTKRGAGLGLAFVKRIAELHNGAIDVSSNLGHGATFTLWLSAQSVVDPVVTSPN